LANKNLNKSKLFSESGLSKLVDVMVWKYEAMPFNLPDGKELPEENMYGFNL